MAWYRFRKRASKKIKKEVDKTISRNPSLLKLDNLTSGGKTWTLLKDTSRFGMDKPIIGLSGITTRRRRLSSSTEDQDQRTIRSKYWIPLRIMTKDQSSCTTSTDVVYPL